MNTLKRVWQRTRRAREIGQSMTEFALSLTMLLWVAVGVLDFGRMYMTYVAIQNAAGEGALFGAIHPTWVTTCPSGHFGCSVSANIEFRTRNETPATATGGLIDWSTATITVTCPDDGGAPCDTGGASSRPGKRIVVKVQYTYQLFTPILSNVWPTAPLQGEAEQLILGDDT